MRISIRFLSPLVLCALILVAACQPTNQNANTTATTAATPPAEQKLTLVPRPLRLGWMALWALGAWAIHPAPAAGRGTQGPRLFDARM